MDSEKQPVMFTRAGFWHGMRDAAPLVVGFIPFGMVVGITGQGSGLSLAEVTLMSAVVFAGSAQVVTLSIWTMPPDIIGLTLACFVVNLRLGLMGPVLSPWLDQLRGWRVWGSLFLMTDHNWALSVRQMNQGNNDAAYLLGGGFALYFPWLAMTVAGYLAGAVLHLPPGHPVFFAALAAFAAMLAQMWRGLGDALPWVVAVLVAVIVSRLLPGTFWHIVAGALCGSLVGGLRDQWGRR
jgi:predicted branched-subunit amino acid permease